MFILSKLNQNSQTNKIFPLINLKFVIAIKPKRSRERERGK